MPFPGIRCRNYAVVTFDPVPTICSGDDAVNLFDLKARSFDPRKALAYHYAVFGHHTTCGSVLDCSNCNPAVGFGGGGRAERPGNDSIVSLGTFLDAGLTPGFEHEASVLMHELGQNFGLRHGGDDNLPNFKPNYVSVMNDGFVYPGIPVADGWGSTMPIPCRVTADCPAEAVCASFSHSCTRIDYSRQTLPSLNEGSLDESIGIGAGTNDLAAYACPGFTGAYGSATGPIDWNCNGTANDATVTADINADGLLIPLTGHRDWGTLNFHHQCSPVDPPGVPPRRGEQEPTIPDAMHEHRLFAPRAVEARLLAAEPGALVVAIMGADDLDTADIDRTSVKLAGASAARTHFADVDGNGRADLVLTFVAKDRRLNAPIHPLHLTGWLENSQSFHATVRP